MIADYSCRLPKSGAYGWGVCSENLRRELKTYGVHTNEARTLDEIVVSSEVCLSAVSDHNFQYTSSILGKKNIGYGFIENNIAGEKMSYYGERLWDHIVCGSTWMQHWLNPKLSIPTSVAIQGVDFDVFHFNEGDENNRSAFTVGSFGKFEFRKGQDLVIKAVSILQERYDDIELVYNWHNDWPNLIREFAWNQNAAVRMMYSVDNEFYKANETEFFRSTLQANKVKNSHNAYRSWMDSQYRACDVILFPNRCEAGTNLCLMEALACGVPCIVTDATGHTDITRRETYPYKDLLLTCGEEATFMQGDRYLGRWYKPCLDEIVSTLEQAYRMRDELRKRRKSASRMFSDLTWSSTAHGIFDSMRSLAYN